MTQKVTSSPNRASECQLPTPSVATLSCELFYAHNRLKDLACRIKEFGQSNPSIRSHVEKKLVCILATVKKIERQLPGWLPKKHSAYKRAALLQTLILKIQSACQVLCKDLHRGLARDTNTTVADKMSSAEREEQIKTNASELAQTSLDEAESTMPSEDLPPEALLAPPSVATLSCGLLYECTKLRDLARVLQGFNPSMPEMRQFIEAALIYIRDAVHGIQDQLPDGLPQSHIACRRITWIHTTILKMTSAYQARCAKDFYGRVERYTNAIIAGETFHGRAEIELEAFNEEGRMLKTNACQTAQQNLAVANKCLAHCQAVVDGRRRRHLISEQVGSASIQQMYFICMLVKERKQKKSSTT